MYLLSVLLFMLISIIFLVMTSGGSIANIGCFISPASLILILLVAIPLIMSAGLIRDFNNAFRLSARSDRKCSRHELQRAVEAISFAIKALWLSGIFSVTLTLIIVLAADVGDTIVLIRSLSVTLLPLMYAIFFIILLMPVKSRLRLRLYALTEPPAPSSEADGL